VTLKQPFPEGTKPEKEVCGWKGLCLYWLPAKIGLLTQRPSFGAAAAGLVGDGVFSTSFKIKWRHDYEAATVVLALLILTMWISNKKSLLSSCCLVWRVNQKPHHGA
jgi:hypothetical protein